jgi:mannose-1-phosphate guanylyltransferase/phosphomannomutase
VQAKIQNYSPCLGNHPKIEFREPLDFDAIVIAGGLGTRSEQSVIPKALQCVGDISIIENQINILINSGVRKVIIVGGFLFEKLELHLENHPSKDRLSLVHDRKLEGTLSALFLGLEKSSSRNLIVVLGDIYFELDFKPIMQEFEEIKSQFTILSHPNSHPYDSDLLKISLSRSKIEFLPKSRLPSDSDGNVAASGIFIFKRSTLEECKHLKGDISTSVIPFLSDTGATNVKFVTNYIADTGTPSRLKKVNEDVIAGFARERSKNARRAIFLDLDNTLIPNIEVKSSKIEFEVNDRLAIEIRKMNSIGIPLFVVSNQPGVAKGFFTLEDFDEFLAKIQSKLAQKNCWIDDWFFCFHHPESGWLGEIPELKKICEFRKPGSMLLDIACKTHHVDASRSVFLGDSLVDKEASDTMGIEFKLVGVDDLEFEDGRISTSEALKEISLR